ncbi:MAG: TonB-dependent receptor [Pedobacter sp.]|nr:MAG: TonB-dependent receptor [Pedobacter sp.]
MKLFKIKSTSYNHEKNQLVFSNVLPNGTILSGGAHAKAIVAFDNETQLLKAYADSHWSEDSRDINALWPRLSPNINDNNNQRSTWFMRDGSFLRLKQVEIGYKIPKSIQRRLHTSNFRIYANATNLLNFSKFDLWDVEMGGDGLGYPIQRVINVGINISLK